MTMAKTIAKNKVMMLLRQIANIQDGDETCEAEVDVAVAPPARKTFFCTFGAIRRLMISDHW